MDIQIPKVSIIVPVHNAGERFIRCLDTLIGQTLREIEIILVLDCPTDGSDNTAKEYAAKDSRIIILENETSLHIGYTRNRGLEIARGEYIGFSDHDDYREQTMYEELYAQAKASDLDILLGTLVEVGDRYELNVYPDIPDEEIRELALKDLFMAGNDTTFAPYAGYILPNLYKSGFLKFHNISFVDSRTATPEDWLFHVKCLYFVEKLKLNRKIYYHHTTHDSNAANTSWYGNYKVVINAQKIIYDFLNQHQCYEKYKIYFFKGVKKRVSDSLLNELMLKKSLKKFIEAVRYVKTMPFIRDAYKYGEYPLIRYRIGGKLSRKILILIMRL